MPALPEEVEEEGAGTVQYAALPFHSQYVLRELGWSGETTEEGGR